MIDKKSLSERDICSKFITPALQNAGWNIQTQVLEEVSFTDGKIYVRGKLTARGKAKRADCCMWHLRLKKSDIRVIKMVKPINSTF